MGKCGSHQAAVDAYREWIQQPAQAHLLRAIPELVGKRLGCWCKPTQCHGDVLAPYANAYAAGTVSANAPLRPGLRSSRLDSGAAGGDSF